MTEKILITGANGFIGSALKVFLSNEYNVIACGRKDLNLLDREEVHNCLKTQKFDIIIHTATYDAAPEFSTKNPDKVLEYNLRMFDNLSQCSSDYGAMFYFGSGAEHRRENQYGLSKYAMDQIAQNKDNVYNLRLYSVYGVGTDWRYRFINNACAKVSLGMPIKIPKINQCDYLNVVDLCKIVKFYMHNFKNIPKSCDMCSGDVFTPEKIVEIINEVKPVLDVQYHDKVSPSVSRSKSSLQAYYGDPAFVASLPVTLTPMRQGVRELLDFYKSNKPNPSEFVY